MDRMRALEILGLEIRDAGNSIALAIHDLANAIRENRPSVYEGLTLEQTRQRVSLGDCNVE